MLCRSTAAELPSLALRMCQQQEQVGALRAEAAAAASQASAALSARSSLEERIRVLEAEAGERNKKFVMMQKTYKTSEEDLKGQVGVRVGQGPRGTSSEGRWVRGGCECGGRGIKGRVGVSGAVSL